MAQLGVRRFRQGAAEVDQVVGDDAEPDPALHTIITFVSAAGEAVPALDDADAALATGSPFLAVAEPALLLLASAFVTLGGTVGDADALDASGPCRGLVLLGIECGVCCRGIG